MNDGYQKYLKAINNKNPMTEVQWMEAVGIVCEEEKHTPLQIRPKKDARPIKATFDNFIEQKVQLPKKAKVETKPRKKMSDEDKRKKKEEWRKGYLQSEKGRAKRREINSRYAERNRKKLNADAVRRYHENKS